MEENRPQGGMERMERRERTTRKGRSKAKRNHNGKATTRKRKIYETRKGKGKE